MTVPTLQVKVCYNEIDFSHEVVRSFSGEHKAAIPCYPTLGARDFSSAVSGFCQVFIVTRAKSFSRGFAARSFGLRPKTCRPSANTETSRRTREKPLVPRVMLS